MLLKPDCYKMVESVGVTYGSMHHLTARPKVEAVLRNYWAPYNVPENSTAASAALNKVLISNCSSFIEGFKVAET